MFRLIGDNASLAAVIYQDGALNRCRPAEQFVIYCLPEPDMFGAYIIKQCFCAYISAAETADSSLSVRRISTVYSLVNSPITAVAELERYHAGIRCRSVIHIEVDRRELIAVNLNVIAVSEVTGFLLDKLVGGIHQGFRVYAVDVSIIKAKKSMEALLRLKEITDGRIEDCTPWSTVGKHVARQLIRSVILMFFFQPVRVKYSHERR